jgi:hypothetical protein
MKVGVCTHETLDKVLTEPVSPLGVDPTLDRVRRYETGNERKSPPNDNGSVYDENSVFSGEMNK